MGEWVVLELGSKAEGEDPDLVMRSIRTTLRSDVEVFIPAAVTTVGDDKVVRYLVEGYGFVRKSLPDTTYLKLENTKYVNTVLTTMRGSIRSVSSVPDREIERLRSQVRAESEQGIGVGDTILITSGAYRQLTAVVIEDIPEHDTVQVFIKLRSKETLVSLPRNFLKLIQKAVRPAFQSKADDLLSWLRQTLPIFLWEEQAITRLVAHRDEYMRLSRWIDEHHTLTDYVRSFEPIALDASTYVRRAQDLVHLAGWVDRTQMLIQIVKGLDCPTPNVESLIAKQKELQFVTKMGDGVQHLLPIYRASTGALDPTPLETKCMNLAWVTSAVTRLCIIGEEVSAIEQALPSATTDIDFEDVPPKTAMYTGPDIQNIIIDGLNLAIRCLFAPGLGELRDSNGRPTGVYIGFLRSLGSLAKRWPSARLHVCWDGSSKRRKEAFPGYKADRPALPLRMEEVEWLREALPKFGVSQSWNRGEEADDAIATLVKSTFAKQQNVFMSTDKDLFQLVSDTDLFLYPAVGKARETLYNPAGVSEKWGVPPEKLVTLRAMLGDTSDRIPGVPGVPQKVLVNLVRSYGTVDKIFASNLAGLSKLQYEKLIGSEAIIRRNVDLMTLRLDVSLETTKPELDRTAAEKRLLDVDAKPDPILAAFFDRPTNGM